MTWNGVRRWPVAAAAAAALIPAAVAHAEPSTDELLQKIEDLSQKASSRGFSLQSADGQNQVKLRGTVHLDGRFYTSDNPANTYDTWQATRVRPTIEGTVGGIYDFRLTPDFGQGRTVLQDAYVTARFKPGFQVTAGKFKLPVGLERLQSANDIRFVSRAFPTSLAPNRDLGVQIAGNVPDERLAYAVAWTNGTNDGGSSESLGDVDVNNGKDLTGRLFALPFGASDHFALRGLGLGIAATHASQTGTSSQTLLPSFRTPSQATFFTYRTGATGTIADGERTRLAPQFYYYVGRFGLLGEYTTVEQDVARTTTAGRRAGTLDNTAWQLAASWFLTGEEESFRGFKPNSPFSLANHTWGAFEVLARYHELDVDDDAFVGGAASFADPDAAASRARGYTLGLNWYFNENLKWVLNYEHTNFEGGAAGGTDRPDEDVFLTRFALGF